MKSIFAAENSGSANTAQSTLQSRIQGVGSTDYTPTQSFTSGPTFQSISFSSQSRPMESMGNPYFNNNAPATQSTPSLSSIMSSDSPARDIISAVTSGVQSVVDRIGKATTSAPTSAYSASPFQQRSDWVPPKLDQVAPPVVSDDNSAAKAAISDLCFGNAARTTPTQQAINTFLTKAETIDGTKLANVIVAKLSDPSVPWVHKMKILSGIETLHASGLDVVTGTIFENGNCILGLMGSVQCGQKAKQVAGLLGLIERGMKVSGKVGGQVGGFDDLLDIGGVVERQETVVVQQSGSSDLLDFCDEPAFVVVQKSDDLLDFNHQPVVHHLDSLI